MQIDIDYDKLYRLVVDGVFWMCRGDGTGQATMNWGLDMDHDTIEMNGVIYTCFGEVFHKQTGVPVLCDEIEHMLDAYVNLWLRFEVDSIRTQVFIGDYGLILDKDDFNIAYSFPDELIKIRLIHGVHKIIFV